MILNALARKLKRQARGDSKSQNFEAMLIATAYRDCRSRCCPVAFQLGSGALRATGLPGAEVLPSY